MLKLLLLSGAKLTGETFINFRMSMGNFYLLVVLLGALVAYSVVISIKLWRKRKG